MRVFEYLLLNNGDMSSDIDSPLQNLTQLAICSIQASWSGSPTGVLSLEVSNNDPHFTPINEITWTTYSGSETNVSGVEGNWVWNLISIGFKLIRIVYTSTSGTGSLAITVSGKGP